MTFRNTCALYAALLLAACGSIQGIVRDAETGQPVPGATVELLYSNDPSGFFFGTKVERATTDGDGRFTIGQDGGYSLKVSSPDGRSAKAEVCARSPMTVYVGGTHPHVKMNRVLVLFASGKPGAGDLPRSERRMEAGALGLSVHRPQDERGNALVIEAEGGVAFVPGTGAIPAAPPLPYPKNLSVDFRKDCGWIFVERHGRHAAVIHARPPSSLSTPNGYKEVTLMFAELPQ
jgi:hypothetical protein